MLAQGEASLLDSLGEAVVAVGDDGRIAYASPAALAALGWDAMLLGSPLVTIIPERLRGKHLAGFSRYVATGESRLLSKPVRVPALLRDGSERELDLAIRVFRRPDGSKLVVAVLEQTGRMAAPHGLHRVESALARRAYELV